MAPFEPDHILPRKSGGTTILDNLAYACPHCNAHKWAHTHGVDPESHETVAIFNPRTQTWTDHFQWRDDGSWRLLGKTACARATIELLQMNHALLLEARRLLAALAFFPPK